MGNMIPKTILFGGSPSRTAWQSGAEEWWESPCVPRRHAASGLLQNQKKSPEAEISASLLGQKKVLVAKTTVLFVFVMFHLTYFYTSQASVARGQG